MQCSSTAARAGQAQACPSAACPHTERLRAGDRARSIRCVRMVRIQRRREALPMPCRCGLRVCDCHFDCASESDGESAHHRASQRVSPVSQPGNKGRAGAGRRRHVSDSDARPEAKVFNAIIIHAWTDLTCHRAQPPQYNYCSQHSTAVPLTV